MEEIKVIDRLQKVCDELDWTVSVEYYERCGEYNFEFENYTDREQHIVQSFSVQDCNDEDEIEYALFDMWNNFDPDEEATLWIGEDGHGKNGAPHNLSDILDDMNEAKDMLEQLCDAYCGNKKPLSSYSLGQKTIYLAYKTDNWHSKESYELLYIGEDIEDVIAQMMAHRGMTLSQSEQVRESGQSSCNNWSFEWDIVKTQLNSML